MKVLFITPHFPPSLGGVENYVFNIAQGLKQIENIEVVVITSHLNSKKQIIEDYCDIKVYRLPVMIRVSNTPINPLWYFSLKRIIWKEKPDIINSHQPVMFMGDVVALVAGEIPFILTYHSGTMKKNRFPIDIVIYLYEKFVLPRIANKATRIICVSRFVRDTLFRNHASKITIISPGVDTSLYQYNPRVKREENLVLFVAGRKNTYRMKGLYYLIDSIKEISGVELHIIGEKEEFLDKSIVSVGIRRGNDLVEELQKASLVVLPSIAIEGFPMVLIEAMACQTPVIGTNIGGIPELIRDGIDGLLVPPQDSNALAQAISKILADKELATRMGRAGEAKVRDQLTWETRVALTRKVFEECLK